MEKKKVWVKCQQVIEYNQELEMTDDELKLLEDLMVAT